MKEEPIALDLDDTLPWNTVFEKEVEYLGYDATALNSEAEPKFTGLCLSGGGVRSAIFCGGVLEYLGEKDLLSEFNYLSTVSGGGYSGAALSYWNNDKESAEKPFELSSFVRAKKNATLPKQDDVPQNGLRETTNPFKYYTHYIRHLRANISYLMPNGFRDALFGTYVVLRSIIINMFIWIGLATGLFSFLLAFKSAKYTPVATLGGARGELGTTTSALGIDAAPESESTHECLQFLHLCEWFGGSYLFWGLGVLAAVALGLLAGLIPLFSLGTFFKWNSGYRWRKRVERVGGALLVAAFVFVPLGLLPVVTQNMSAVQEFITNLSSEGSVSIGFGIFGTVAGSAISIFGLFRARLGGLFGNASSATVVLGAALLVASAAVLSMHFAQNWPTGHILLFFGCSAVLAFVCNINDVSLGRFYRDRLMEAFLPNKDMIKNAGRHSLPLAISGGGTADEADKLTLSELQRPHGTTGVTKRSPHMIHLINSNVLSWWAPDTRSQRRKGDNFILSPLFCGSDMTRWKKTEQVAKNRLTLATAMAVSGAAVNPQGGFAGQGPTTSWPVSIAMSLLSLRLGYWLRWRPVWSGTQFGNHINPGLTQLVRRLASREVRPTNPGAKFGTPHKHAPTFLELSDGGHFDNLGLYEMIRRECRLIVVCDGGHDPANSYEAFAILIRRAKEDFGAEIKFDVEFNKKWSRRSVQSKTASAARTGPQDLVARNVDNEYPSGAEYAEKGYFLASVTYDGETRTPDEDGYRAGRARLGGKAPRARKGLIVYMKSTLIRDVELTTKGYRGSNPLFPSDPTSNQFFSPEQFEAYRDLGKKIARQMDRDLILENLISEMIKDDVSSHSEIAAELAGLSQFA